MSRILIAWELGGNWGHLAHTVPVAEKLRGYGHEIFFAAKNTRTAAEILSQHVFNYVQSPLCSARRHPLHPPLNYAGILAAEGWGDNAALTGHIRAWINLIELGRFDAVVAEHAPGALIAAAIIGCTVIPFGNGFEIPPDIHPMPTIRSWERRSPEELVAGERHVLGCINKVVKSHGKTSYPQLGSIFPRHSILATFPELDHYGARKDGCYVGSIHGLKNGLKIDWPSGNGPKILVYLREQHRAAIAVMNKLHALDARAVCVVPNAGDAFRQQFAKGSVVIHDGPVAFGSLLDKADAFVSYAGIGTAAEVLLKGVPIVMIPRTVEQYLVACRIEEMGAGLLAKTDADHDQVGQALDSVLANTKYRETAMRFAEKYKQTTAERAAKHAANLINDVVQKIGELQWLACYSSTELARVKALGKRRFAKRICTMTDVRST